MGDTKKMDTQLSKVNGYKPKKSMIFCKPITKKVKGSKNIEYKLINILTKNEDGTNGELILATPCLFSFGVSKNIFQEKENGYTFPICLRNKDGATKEEKIWTNTFNKIVDRCVDHIVNSDDFVENEMTREELSREKGGINPLYWNLKN